MSQRGAGDRWLGREPVEGVAFGPEAPVEVTAGPHAGKRGTVLLLVLLRPEPKYVVELEAGEGRVRVPQSALRGAE